MIPQPEISTHDALDDPLPLGERFDHGATLETFVTRHARVSDAQADVLRGLLDLASVTQRIVNAVPDLCWNHDVARGQRTLANTLRVAAMAYLALHGRQVVASPASGLSLSGQLLAASRDAVNDWLLTVATPPTAVQSVPNSLPL